MLESQMMPAPSDGDTVMLSGIEGAVQLNGLRLMVRTDHKPRYQHPPNSGKWCMKFHVTLPDTPSPLAAYTSHGQVTQVVLPETASFDPLSLCLAAPGKQSMMFFFREKWTSLAPAQLHVAFAAFNALSTAQPGSRLRAPPSPNDFLAACRAMHAALPPHSKDLYGELNEDAMRTFCRTCFGNLNPISAVAGGIAAQEAIKACSQKFPPMCDPQFLYFDALDAAPDAADTSLQNSRYDGQLAVFGQRVQEVLEGLNVFLVGAGALGCEILKNFALMGVGCGQHGRVVVTDNDHIEKSNVSRQFLFRSHHIGKSKSACAAESVTAIYGSLR
jgi:ubiquitin-activating enzyme E1